MATKRTAGYFGTAQAANGLTVSTGETTDPIRISAGDHDAAVRVTLYPTGRFEIEIVDAFGGRVGHVIEPTEKQKGRRVVKGTLAQ